MNQDKNKDLDLNKKGKNATPDIEKQNRQSGAGDLSTGKKDSFEKSDKSIDQRTPGGNKSGRDAAPTESLK